jgi:hypothetical protein
LEAPHAKGTCKASVGCKGTRKACPKAGREVNRKASDGREGTCEAIGSRKAGCEADYQEANRETRQKELATSPVMS